MADVEVLVSEKNNKHLVLSIFFFSRPDVVNLVKLGNVVVVDVEDRGNREIESDRPDSPPHTAHALAPRVLRWGRI